MQEWNLRRIVEYRMSGCTNDLISQILAQSSNFDENLTLLSKLLVDLDTAYLFGKLGGHVKLLSCFDSDQIKIIGLCEACATNIVSSCCPYPMMSSGQYGDLKGILTFPTCNNTNLLIRQVIERQRSQADTGFLVWGASIALARMIVGREINLEPPSLSRQWNILEIGSGIGLPGLSAASLFQYLAPNYSVSILLSDFSTKVLENLRYNISLNFQSLPSFLSLSAVHMDWTMPQSLIDIDLIIGSDVICKPEDSFNIARLCRDVLRRPNGKGIFMLPDSRHRFGTECFESDLDEQGFVFTRNRVSMDEVVSQSDGGSEIVSWYLFVVVFRQ